MSPYLACEYHRFNGARLKPYTAEIHFAARAMGSSFLPIDDDDTGEDAPEVDAAFSALWSVWLMADGDAQTALADPDTARDDALTWAESNGFELLPLAASAIYAAWLPIGKAILDQWAIPSLPSGYESENRETSVAVSWWADYVADCAAATNLTEPEILATVPLARGLMYRNLAARKAGYDLHPA